MSVLPSVQCTLVKQCPGWRLPLTTTDVGEVHLVQLMLVSSRLGGAGSRSIVRRGSRQATCLGAHGGSNHHQSTTTSLSSPLSVSKHTQVSKYTVTGKNSPPKQNAVKCTIYNTI